MKKDEIMGRIMENIRYLGYHLTLESIKHFFKLIKIYGFINAIKVEILGKKFHRKHCDFIYGRKKFKGEREAHKYLFDLGMEFSKKCEELQKGEK